MKVLKNNKGSVVVEVAAMFMLVTMMATGYLYFIQAMRINTVIKIAAREGAREFSVSNDTSRAEKRVRSELSLAGINPDEKSIKIDTKKDGQKRVVNIRGRHNFYSPFSGEYRLNLKSGAEYVLENNSEFEGR